MQPEPRDPDGHGPDGAAHQAGQGLLDCAAAAARLASALGLAAPCLRGGPASSGMRPATKAPGPARRSHWIRGGLHCAATYRAVVTEGVRRGGAAPAAAPDEPGYLDALRQAIRDLPPDRAVALALLAVEGLSPAEAGEVLGADPEAVRLLANTARDEVVAAAAAGGGARILVAEDERVVAFELREILRRLGHKVVALAATAGEALSRASFERPDLALIDVRLKGGTDGVAALREMRHAFGVPSVVITAFGDQRDRAEGAAAAELGLQAYGFLVKPWGEGELRNAVTDALIRIAVENALGAPPVPPPGAGEGSAA